MPGVNADMLVLAREYRGLTQSELARRAKVTQGYVSKYEHGQLEPSGENIERIAAALDVPVSFLYRTDQVFGFASACLHHRKQASLPVRELRQVHALVNVIRLGLAPMLRDVEVATVPKFYRLDVEEYGGDPARIAALVRAQWQMPLGPVANVITTLEAAGSFVFRCAFGNRRIDAVSQWPAGSQPLFFVNSDSPWDRARFTLAHELGHVVMHAVPTVDMEREANVFAQEFLMPAQQISGDLEGFNLVRATELKAYWKVSIQALTMRARSLGLLSPDQTSRIFMQLSKLGYRLVEPWPLPPELPTLVQRVVDVQTEENANTLADLAHIANVPDFMTHFTQERSLRLVM
jgi:Zn-dependent peptidase ImmA (M78 family)/transcriptional regulator with XRE-family HTH domain